MNRKTIIRTAGMAAVLPFGPSLIYAAVDSVVAKPNVVFILMDDLGYGDLSCYNPQSGISTPNIDRIAEGGVRFTQFYSASNVCSPSRRALLTGRYQSRLGEWAEAYASTPTDDAISASLEPCFPLYLKKAGYVTGSFGKWNIGSVNGVSTPDAQGFDYWIGSFHNTSYFGHNRNHGVKDFWENGILAPQYDGKYSDDVFIDKAIEFIKANQSKPFFVYLPLCTPHTPYQDPENPVEGSDLAGWNEHVKDQRKGDGPPIPEDRPVMKKMIEYVDRRIGDLTQTLVSLGLDENTIVILTSDNGGTPASVNTPLRGFKQGMLEGGIRVPAIIKWPAVYPKGKVISQVGIMMDFSKTIVEATGSGAFVDKAHELDGIDLTSILIGIRGEQERSLGWRRREWSASKNGGYNNIFAEAYIKGEWKYIKEFREVPGFAKSIDGKYPDAGYIELLYHLSGDVHEDKNLAQQIPGKLDELRTEFDSWKTNTVDRNKHYTIPFPDQYSPVRQQARSFTVSPSKKLDSGAGNPDVKGKNISDLQSAAGKSVVFDFADNQMHGTLLTRGNENRVSVPDIRDGILQIEISPGCVHPFPMIYKEGGIDTVQFTKLVLHMKISSTGRGGNCKAFAMLRSSGWRGKDLPIPVQIDGQWHDYTVDVSKSPAWAGWTQSGRIGLVFPNSDSDSITTELDTITLEK